MQKCVQYAGVGNRGASKAKVQLVTKSHESIYFNNVSLLFGQRTKGNKNRLKNAKVNVLLRRRRGKLY